MHAWNFSQTFALAWIGEQSFRCIDPTHSLRIFEHHRLVQVSVSQLAPVYARRQIILLTDYHLNKYACQLTYFHIGRKKRQKARYRFISYNITNDGYKYKYINIYL